MMALVADYATADVQVQNRPSPWVAALLTVLTPGLGHLYIGQARRGITLFIFVMIADTLLMFAMMGVLARFWMFATSLALLLGLWLYIGVDAVLRARRAAHFALQSHNRWAVFAGAFVLACLVFAAPCIYGLRAKASGRLLWLNATTPSMEPTLETGEYILADASYYQARQPMRGEVAVYRHPKNPDIHLIKRIIAVEGDRVAMKGGRAVVNGIGIEEPYLEPLLSGMLLPDMPEMRVPAGHVFVLGDNRANSLDSRNLVEHGPVPFGNLIGRVTDVAISRHWLRMGRWIGTPSNL
jgi:signal peptidase I